MALSDRAATLSDKRKRRWLENHLPYLVRKEDELMLTIFF